MKTSACIALTMGLLFFSCQSNKKTVGQKEEGQESLSPVEVTNIHPNNINSEEDEVCFTIDTCVKAYDAKVYNRWATALWESSRPGECWNGIDPKTGKLLPEGGYFLLVNWTTCNNLRKQYKGTVYIIRKS